MKNDLKDEKPVSNDRDARNAGQPIISTEVIGFDTSNPMLSLNEQIAGSTRENLEQSYRHVVVDMAFACYFIQAAIQSTLEPVEGTQFSYDMGQNPTLIAAAFILSRHALAEFDPETHIMTLTNALQERPPQSMEELKKADSGVNQCVCRIIEGMMSHGELR